jgi:O-antigen/teichoic acid export membrane protein
MMRLAADHRDQILVLMLLVSIAAVGLGLYCSRRYGVRCEQNETTLWIVRKAGDAGLIAVLILFWVVVWWARPGLTGLSLVVWLVIWSVILAGNISGFRRIIRERIASASAARTDQEL